jgi:hypothetical protein
MIHMFTGLDHCCCTTTTTTTTTTTSTTTTSTTTCTTTSTTSTTTSTTYTTLFLASLRTRHEMSRTSKSASRYPVNDEQPSHGEQGLDGQLTQEQFDNELEKGLEVMLTQEDLLDDEDPVGGA